MDNVRFIPMDNYLYTLLQPISKGKLGRAFVFVNNNGNPIDDKMFQRRVFRPLLNELDIEKRDRMHVAIHLLQEQYRKE
jgi:integrase